MFSRSAGANAATVSIQVQGMACASCVERVEKAILATPGVASASVDLATQRAEVTFSGRPDTGAVVVAIRNAGYDVVTGAG